MAKRLRRAKAVTPGQRVGTKRRDMRWEAEGEVWDSRFEYEVFRGYRDAGWTVRRCTEADSLTYTRPVRNGVCGKCNSEEVASRHSYQPDLFVSPGPAQQGRKGSTAVDEPAGYFVEAKGYLRADRRSLLRALRKARPDVDLRLVCQRDYRVSAKHSLISWARTFLKCPAAVWTGGPPEWPTS